MSEKFRLSVSEKVTQKQWNDVASSMPSCALHSYEWATFSAENNNGLLTFFKIKNKEGNTVAIAHGVKHTSRVFGVPIESHFSFGCLPAAVNSKSRNEMICRIIEHAQKAGMVRIIFNSFGTPGECSVFDELGFKRKNRWEFVLDINRPLDDIWKNLHSKKRNLIRKAQKTGITVHQCKEFKDFLQYRQLSLDTWRRKISQGTPFPRVAKVSYFKRFQKSLIDKGLARLYLATSNGNAVAGAVFVCFGQSAYYMLSSANDDGLRKSGPDLILWSAITDFQNEGLTVFNFGGISEEELGGKPLEKSGLYHFKKRFSPEIVPACKATLVLQPHRDALIEKMRKIKKNLFNIIRR